MRAGTCAPSLAGTWTISGTIQSWASHSAVGDDVTRRASAPGRLGAMNSSGGWFAKEWTKASLVPSGETVATYRPGSVVTRIRPRPSSIIDHRCWWCGDPSFVVSRNRSRPGDSSTLCTSQLPLVRGRSAEPSAFTV
jgi:hypothetical protein